MIKRLPRKPRNGRHACSRAAFSVEELTEFYHWRRMAANAEAYAALERVREKSGRLGTNSDNPDTSRRFGHWIGWRSTWACWRSHMAKYPARAAAGLATILLIAGLAGAWLLAAPRYQTATDEQLAVSLACYMSHWMRKCSRTYEYKGYKTDLSGFHPYDCGHQTPWPSASKLAYDLVCT